MTVGTGDVLRRAAGGQALRIALTVRLFTGTAVEGEMASLVDERSDLGIDTSVGGTAEVGRSGLGWSLTRTSTSN